MDRNSARSSYSYLSTWNYLTCGLIVEIPRGIVVEIIGDPVPVPITSTFHHIGYTITVGIFAHIAYPIRIVILLPRIIVIRTVVTDITYTITITILLIRVVVIRAVISAIGYTVAVLVHMPL